MKVRMRDMREAVAKIYGQYFVKDMPPRQVAAIYNSMKSRGYFNKENNNYHQMCLDEWLYEMKGEILWEQTT